MWLHTLAHWILAVLLGIHAAHSERCSDALYCMHNIDGVREDMFRDDFFTICSKTMKFVTCVEASIKDCHLSSIQIPEENMIQLSNSIKQAKGIYRKYCDGVTPRPVDSGEHGDSKYYQAVPSSASCQEVTLCMLDVTAFTNAISNGRSQDACNLIVPSVGCLQNALLDCERHGNLPQDKLSVFRNSLEDSRSKLNRFCVADPESYEMVSENSTSGSSPGLSMNLTAVLGLLTVCAVTKVVTWTRDVWMVDIQ